MAVDLSQGLDGPGVLAADQHPIGLLEIADGGDLRQDLGVGKHQKALEAGGRVGFCGAEDGGDYLGGALDLIYHVPCRMRQKMQPATIGTEASIAIDDGHVTEGGMFALSNLL